MGTETLSRNSVYVKGQERHEGKKTPGDTPHHPLSLWPFLLRHSILSLPPYQNIIRKVSGQKFVYKFVSYPEVAGCSTEDCPPQPEVSVTSTLANAGATAVHAIPGDTASGKPGTLKGAGMAGPGSLARSSRNDYMRSGLYSTFTIQSLQPQPPSHPRPSTVLPSTGPAGVAVPPSGSRSTSPNPLEACLEAEEAGLPLQVRTGIWNFSKRRDVQFPNIERDWEEEGHKCPVKDDIVEGGMHKSPWRKRWGGKLFKPWERRRKLSALQLAVHPICSRCP